MAILQRVTSNGEFCSECKDYIGSPIGSPRKCQGCEEYNPTPIMQKEDIAPPSEEQNPDREKIPNVVRFIKLVGENYKFYKGNEFLFDASKNAKTGKIYATYKGKVIVRKSPDGIKWALNFEFAK